MPTKDRKHKYGEPTSMLAIRVPVSLDEKLQKRARRLQKPKSETAVDILKDALVKRALLELDVARDLDVVSEAKGGVFE